MKWSNSDASIEAILPTFDMVRNTINRMDFQYERILIFDMSQRIV